MMKFSVLAAIAIFLPSSLSASVSVVDVTPANIEHSRFRVEMNRQGTDGHVEVLVFLSTAQEDSLEPPSGSLVIWQEDVTPRPGIVLDEDKDRPATSVGCQIFGELRGKERCYRVSVHRTFAARTTLRFVFPVPYMPAATVCEVMLGEFVKSLRWE